MNMKNYSDNLKPMIVSSSTRDLFALEKMRDPDNLDCYSLSCFEAGLQHL